MSATEYANFSQTVSTTEYSITNGTTTLATNTDAGVFDAEINFDTLAAGDIYRVRVYEKTISGGAQGVDYEAFVWGAQSQRHVVPAFLLKWGWDIAVVKIAGTNRTITARVMQAG